MNFKIRTKRSKEEYNEYLSCSNYVKKLIKNPKKKIPSFSRKLNNFTILTALLLVVSLFEEFFIKHDKTNYMIIIPLIFVLVSLIVIKMMTNMEIKNFKTLNEYIECEVDEKKFLFKYNDDYVEYKWDDLKNIIINKYTICFIPKVLPGNFISIPIQYKSELKKIIKKYNKEELLIDNSKLY